MAALQHSASDIFDVGEIARLFTVAENGGRRALDQGFHKQREDAGVWTGRILPFAIDVEESQRDGFQAEAGVEHAGVLLAHELLHGVRRLGARQHGLHFGQHLGVAVGG